MLHAKHEFFFYDLAITDVDAWDAFAYGTGQFVGDGACGFG